MEELRQLHSQPREKWALLGLTMVACALRLHSLDSGLWYDEIATLVDSVRVPLHTTVTHFPGNSEHPLYSVFAHASIALFGEHAWSLRLPAVVFGIATIPLLYIFGRTVTTRAEALWTSALLTVSYHHVWFSQDARAYTILLFSTLLTTLLLLAGLRTGRASAYVGYAAASAMAAYAHLTMVLIVVGQAGVVFWHIWTQRRGRLEFRDLAGPGLGFGLAGLLTVVLYSPMLVEVQTFYVQGSRWARAATATWAATEALRGLRIGYPLTGALLVAGLLFLAGCWSYARQRATILALFFVPAGVLLAVAVLVGRPIFPRFFFFLAGFGLLVLVRGVFVAAAMIVRRLPLPLNGANAGRWAAGVMIGGATLVSVIALPAVYRYPKQDYGGALRFVDAAIGPNDTIVLAGVGTSVPYQRYYGRPWRRLRDPADLVRASERGGVVWVLYTLRQYIDAMEPALMAELTARCEPVKAFPATVAGGRIVVLRCSPGGPRSPDR